MRADTSQQPPTSRTDERGPDQYRVTACRICGGNALREFLSLGTMPIPNGFLARAELHHQEPRYPLSVTVCTSCWLVQLRHVIPPELMFRNYLYIPSTSRTMLQHFARFADEMVRRHGLAREDLVVDIGSNDGTLLRFFREYEVRVLGIDPAENLAQVARLQGVETLETYFSSKVAAHVRQQYGRARLITATNVLAHIDTLHDACDGIRTLLAPDGACVCEFPYLPNILEQNEFDTIYHEHLSYFSLQPLIRLFNDHGLTLVDAEPLSVHGGSLRITVTQASARRAPSPAVSRFLNDEQRRGLPTLPPYEAFARRVAAIQTQLVARLQDVRARGGRVVGYGASAKGNVLLNSCRIGPDLIEYIVDSIPYKQGRYTPGTHIPIFPEKRLENDTPECVLLLAWNFTDEIQAKLSGYLDRGGQLITHVPTPHRVGARLPSPAPAMTATDR